VWTIAGYYHSCLELFDDDYGQNVKFPPSDKQVCRRATCLDKIPNSGPILHPYKVWPYSPLHSSQIRNCLYYSPAYNHNLFISLISPLSSCSLNCLLSSRLALISGLHTQASSQHAVRQSSVRGRGRSPSIFIVETLDTQRGNQTRLES